MKPRVQVGVGHSPDYIGTGIAKRRWTLAGHRYNPKNVPGVFIDKFRTAEICCSTPELG